MLTARKFTDTAPRHAAAAHPSVYPVVAFATHHWRPDRHHSGVVTYTANLVAGIQQLDTPVCVIANQGTPDRDENFVRLVPSWHDLPPTSLQRIIGGLGRRIAPQRTQAWMMAKRLLHVLHQLHQEFRIELFETEESCGIARLLLKRSPVPVVVRIHGPWFLVGPATGEVDGRQFLNRVRAEGLALAAAAGLSAPSRDVLQRAEDFYQKAFANAVVIPNPVRPVPQSELWSAAKCDGQRLLFVGRFDRAKGVDILLDAFSRVLHANPSARLTMVGSDSGITDHAGNRLAAREYIARRFPDPARAAHVEWLGLKSPEEIAALRRECFASVVSSRYESFSMVTLEAMAAGTPVVAPRVGGIPEIVHHERNGLLCRPGDPADLAEKILLLMNNHGYAARLAKQASTDAAVNYNPVTIARRTLDFHQEVLNRYVHKK